MIVVAAMFMTAEYRCGLIRVTLAASPRRGQVLAAKAVVIASAAFVAGLAGVIAAVTAEEPLLRARGNFILPVSAFTEIRAVGGTALLLAVAAVLTLALGAILRSSAHHPAGPRIHRPARLPAVAPATVKRYAPASVRCST